MGKLAKKIIELGICACCGGKYAITDHGGFVQLGCDNTNKVSEPCKNYGSNCKVKDCILESLAEKQKQDGVKLLESVKIAWKEHAKVLLSIPNEETIAFCEFLRLLREEGWLIGKHYDKHGAYYRLFPSEADYAEALIIAYVEGWQDLDEDGIIELTRLSVSIDLVKDSMRKNQMRPVTEYFR